MNALNRSMLVLLLAATAAYASSNINTINKWAWSENAGWLNWRDAGSPPAAHGARIHTRFLSGFIWAENVGWINLGDGDPGAPGGVELQYANADSSDFGVNLEPFSGVLSGYAWGENVGWINFAAGAQANPPNPARVDSLIGACRLRGVVWSENLGWISLDDATHFVGTPCGGRPGDMNCDGLVNGLDIQTFELAMLAPATYAATYPDCNASNGDIDANGAVTSADAAPFVACVLIGGCP